jgi:hypothetical protein
VVHFVQFTLWRARLNSGFVDDDMNISATTVNRLGLLLDVVGAVFLFKFGLPPDFNPYGHDALLWNAENREERKRGDRYRFWSRAGVALLIAGFMLQLASNYLS